MRVVWTQSARLDLKEILEFYDRRNPVAARELIKDIQFSASQLEFFPELGRKSEDGKTRLQQVPRRPYLLPYRIVELDVEILAVFDERRQRPGKYQ
jgi:toxin ParE1/3/4